MFAKIKTKDDTDKLPLKSNQSIIQLHNSTVTVNKHRQKDQNCARNCAFKYGRCCAGKAKTFMFTKQVVKVTT